MASYRVGDRIQWCSQAKPIRSALSQQPLKPMTVLSVAPDGMVEVSGYAGLFAPVLFELVEARVLSGAELITEERARQLDEHGWSADHDDGHDGGELAVAAICYAAPDPVYVEERSVGTVAFIDPWPWDEADDARPRDGDEIRVNRGLPLPDRIRLLVKAGALIAAEIDRLHRIREQRLREWQALDNKARQET